MGLSGQVFGPRSSDHVPEQCQIGDRGQLARRTEDTKTRNILFAGVALLGLCGAAHADSDIGDYGIDKCHLNEMGESLLRGAIMNARYDISSRERIGMMTLGFSNDEYTARSESEQVDDVMVRTGRVLSKYNDSVMLPMAQARHLDQFFYTDTSACLKHVYHDKPVAVSHGGEVKVIVAPAQSAPKAWSTQPAAIPNPAYDEQVRISNRLHKSHKG